MSDKPDELDIEEAAVRAALRRRMVELKESAGRLADPRPWVEERPWSSCAGAAAAGFAVGWLMGGRSKPKGPQQPESHHEHEREHDSRRSVSAMLAASVLPAVQPMLRELVENAMGAVGLHHGGHAPDMNQAADVPVPEAMSPGITGDNQMV